MTASRRPGHAARPPWRPACLLLPALLALGACGMLPTPRAPATAPPPAPPAAWSGAADAALAQAGQGASLAAWWQRFGDERLVGLIEQALRANHTVAGARAALLQARATRDAAAAGLGVNVSLSASAQQNKVGTTAATETYNAGFTAAWEPDVFGLRRNALAAGEAELRASEVSLADVQLAVAAEVALDYIALRGAQTRLAIARDNLANQLETLQITDWRVQAGALTALEGEQARAASEQAAAQLPPLATSAAQLAHALALLCGTTPDAMAALLAQPAAVPQAGADLVLSLPADTLRQRPDVRAAEHRLNAALARVSQADAARYPAFRLEGSIGLRGLGIGSSNGTDLLRALLASVTGQAFDGGASRAQVRLQQGVLAQTEAAYRGVVLTALQEVEDALSAIGGERERLRRLGNAADAAGNAALLARQRYSSGLVDFQTVLETQRSLYASQDGVASTAAALSADHVRLYKALGGGWTPDSVADGAKAGGAATNAAAADAGGGSAAKAAGAGAASSSVATAPAASISKVSP
ncbi:efflux transporter outer membrane subunit [Rugamonas sp. DEMB1]|uniref:efflux transporter outer membrane subunit n=1 Tax=Rugamonas sp. DEMB1 TaxID=3039386 RepID=UPI0024484BA3|nr:efflux transporter outer membrane subunit [Rugamonas sp. DEMB1]WGG53211.1 efflux transporter outer membrane subunit [Rugamonas sp. DEMB1]